MCAISYGIDLTTNSTYTVGYTSFYVSPFYTVGNNLQKRKFKEIEFQLAQPLRSGEGIKLEYRTELNGSYTTIRTIEYGTYGAIVSQNIVTEIPNDIKACEQVQFRVSMTSSATATPGSTTPYLKSVIVR